MSRRVRVSGWRNVVAAALGCGAVVLGGCHSAPRFNVGPQKSAAQRSEAFPVDFETWGRVGWQLDWKGYPSVTGTLPVTQVVPAADGIAVLEGGTTVSMLEVNTGGQRCATTLATPLTRFVGMVRQDGRVLAASDSELFILDAQTCTLVGRQRFSKIVASPPVLVGNVVVMGTVDGELFGHVDAGPAGGVRVWGFATTGAIDRRPVVVGEVVAAASQGGEVVFLIGQSGTLVGRATMFGGVATDPVSNGQLVFVASLDQSLYAFDPRTGRQVWRHRTSAPLRSQPTAFGDRVWCAVEDSGLTAFEAGTGRVVWSNPKVGGRVVGLNRGRLFVWDGKEGIVLNPATGDVISRAVLPGVRSMMVDSFENGTLWVVSTSGVVGKFRGR